MRNKKLAVELVKVAKLLLAAELSDVAYALGKEYAYRSKPSNKEYAAFEATHTKKQSKALDDAVGRLERKGIKVKSLSIEAKKVRDIENPVVIIYLPDLKKEIPLELPNKLEKGTKFRARGGTNIEVKGVWISIFHARPEKSSPRIKYNYKTPDGKSGTEENTLVNFIRLIKQGV